MNLYSLNGIIIAKYLSPWWTWAELTEADKIIAMMSKGAYKYITLISLAVLIFIPFNSQAQVVINELSYNWDPDVLPDPDDWVELYNRGSSPVDMEDWQFVDELGNIFPIPSIVLQPGEYLILAQIKANFLLAYPGVNPSIVIGDFGPIQGGLENNGEQLTLLNETGGIHEIVTYKDGFRWGSESDSGGSTLSLRDPAVNNTNDPTAWGASQTPGGTPGEPNGNLLPKISIDNPVDGGDPYIAPSQIVIDGECIDEDGSVNQVEIFYDVVNVPDIPVSLGTATCNGGFYSFTWFSPPNGFLELKAVATDNVGATSSSNKPDIEVFATDPCLPVPAPLVINEINYNSAILPDPKDWVEIYNPTSSTVDVAAWKMKDESDSAIYGFPSGSSIPPDGYLIVTKSKLNFQAVFPTVTNVIGDFSFGFGGNDVVRIFSPTDCLVDDVDYDNDPPWPITPDGSGPTLVLRDPNLDNSLASSWSASSGNGSPGEANGFLPVELISFDVDLFDDEALLSWSTASELNNAGFEIQHAADQSDFELVDFVEGHGTTTEVKSYEFSISNLEPGLNRFRLKQTDFDGATEFSPIVEIIVDMVDEFVLYPAYPNPFNPSTTIRFGAKYRGLATVELYDLQGRLKQELYSGQLNIGEIVQVKVDASKLSAGTYLVRLSSQDKVLTQSITLLK